MTYLTRFTKFFQFLSTSGSDPRVSRIRASGFFDEDWYLERYPDVKLAGLDPVRHYLEHGVTELRDPSASFSTRYYLETYKDVAQAKLNPLLHYLEYGRDEGRLAKRHGKANATPKQAMPAKAKSLPSQGTGISGRIDRIERGRIIGSFTAPTTAYRPLLTVDGRPIPQIDHPLTLPSATSGASGYDDDGFSCRAPALKEGALIELHAMEGGHFFRLAKYTATTPQVETAFLAQLAQATAIAQQPDAVAIACWDGAHNPIGRAKVLYDVLRHRRPCIIVSYLFEEFGKQVWPPLQSTDTVVLTIPWRKRHLYHRAIRDQGLAFDTVWICKPRFPAFQLAALLSKPQTRLLLDFDDNEEHFSRSAGSLNKPYGLPLNNLARHLSEQVAARTAASATLVQDFNAYLLRHARQPEATLAARARARRNPAFQTRIGLQRQAPKIGFIGTVRPHKNLLGAARAMQAFNQLHGMDATLHVYGDVAPEAYATELAANRVIVKQMIPMAELAEHLSQMDVVLTGFPSPSESDTAITRYQISSKIGDALALGLPVLVPRGPSVADLEGVPGVFLFDEPTFGLALNRALEPSGVVSLPHDFTFSGAYEAFVAAEAKAEASPRAKDALLDLSPISRPTDSAAACPTLLLVWKQHDAQIYGRRIDQLARSYKRAHPDHQVVIMELMDERSHNNYRQSENDFASEASLILGQMSSKARSRISDDGIMACQISYDSVEKLPDLFEQFLIEHTMLPDNTVVVLYPIVRAFGHLAETLEPYPTIIDVVDNQLSWATSEEQRTFVSQQYFVMFRNCDQVIFNSVPNRDYFVELGFIPESTPHMVVPNWYELPNGIAPGVEARRQRSSVNVLYSGNMNDRIDWTLIQRVAELSDTIRVHLVGTSRQMSDAFQETLRRANVLYHGALSERDTLHLMKSMDIAIVPHVHDDVSAYMNPLKVQMYAALGLPTIATAVPGLTEGSLLKVVASDDAFVAAVREVAAAAPRPFAPQARRESAAPYLRAIAEIRAKRAGTSPAPIARLVERG